MHHLRGLALSLLVAACGLASEIEDGIDDSVITGGKADGGYTPAEIAGALRVANELAFEALDDDVGLSSRTARNIVATRDGADHIAGTADDAPFTTLAELDAVPYVGPAALERLVKSAHELGWIDDFASLQRLQPATVAEDDGFGVTLARSGAWLAVAAPGTRERTGAVYLYERVGSGWAYSATLSSPSSGDESFGSRVALDGSTLVVGARRLDASGTTYVHHAHVFVRSGATWSLQQSIPGVDGAVALSNDTLAAAVPAAEAIGGTRVVIYQRSGASWTAAATLTDAFDAATNPQVRFARALALDGDTLAVTSITGYLPPRNGNDTRPIGVVDVYTRTGSTWAPVRLAPDATSAEYGGDFGASLAIDGATLVVGAPVADGRDGVEHAGSATVYVRSGATWQRQQLLHPTVAIRNAQFGASVDVDGDRVVVGAKGDGTPRATFPYSNLAGAAYVFGRAGSAWSETARVAATAPTAYASFGGSVDVEGDSLVVSAWQESEWRTTSPGVESRLTLGAVYAN